jgi:hypothetical protein
MSESKFYMVREKKTGLYHDVGGGLSTTGKAYASISRAKNALIGRWHIESDKAHCKRFEIVEFTTTETGIIPYEGPKKN